MLRSQSMIYTHGDMGTLLQEFLHDTYRLMIIRVDMVHGYQTWLMVHKNDNHHHLMVLVISNVYGSYACST